MLRKLLLGVASVAAGLALAGPTQAQTFDGVWEGTLQAGFQKFRLELEVKTEGKEMGAQLISLDQNNQKIPATAVKVETGELGVLLLNMGAEIKGKVEPDGKTFKGTFWQGASLPLTLTRKATPATTAAAAPKG